MNLLSVFGGPGCGKTTRLLQIVENELAAGVSPKKICYTTFTRKAAEEAKTRAADKFGLSRDEDLRWFSTLHSLAYRSLGLTQSEVMTGKEYAVVAESIGQTITSSARHDDTTAMWSGPLPGDTCIFIEQLSRSMCRTLEDVATSLAFDPWDARLWANAVSRWKAIMGFVDFTDMIELALTRDVVPVFEVLIVDEAQDLSLLQWQLVLSMMARAERVYIGGDDDQAIYEWSGADVEQYLRTAAGGSVEVLSQSHRLPRAVFDVASSILPLIRKRQHKIWAPAREGGHASTVFSFQEVADQLAPAGGSWYLLARNKLYLRKLKAHCYHHGWPFMCEGRSSLDTPEVRAARAWTTLQHGNVVSIDDALLLLAKLKGGMMLGERKKKLTGFGDEIHKADLIKLGMRDTDLQWADVLDMTAEARQYIRMVRQRGLKLTAEPWITISTIHQVKGGEADNVWLETNMTRKSFKAAETDAEHRVFYVGASRAKQRLFVADRTSSHGYKELRP